MEPAPGTRDAGTQGRVHLGGLKEERDITYYYRESANRRRCVREEPAGNTK